MEIPQLLEVPDQSQKAPPHLQPTFPLLQLEATAPNLLLLLIPCGHRE